MQETERSRTDRPIIFGEVLFDCFEDGTAVLGGAPFNVAWHLQGFGLNPLFISRVGRDPLGGKVRTAMQGWGMDLTGLQEDADHPTGTVRITLAGGQPSFSILPEQAYDFIDAQAAENAVATVTPALFYHGSLAARHPVSARALRALRLRLKAPSFVDINLRAPWWSAETVKEAMDGSNWLKLNDHELAELIGEIPPDAEFGESADRLRSEHGVETLVLTLGAAGARIVTAGGAWQASPPQVAAITDTVGAGDAFSAVTLLGILRGWEPERILRRAMDFAAAICKVRGATVADPVFYRHYLEIWLS